MAFFLIIFSLGVAGGKALITPIGTQPYSEIAAAFDPTENFEEQGRISTMIFDDHGHSPFNFYDAMPDDGACIQVTVRLFNQLLNVTVACEGTESYPAADDTMVCPTWKGSHQWRAAYVTVRRMLNQLTVEGCIPFNETHQIYGSLQIDEQIMTKKKVFSQPGAVEFNGFRECTCRFRNEFVIDLSKPSNVEQRSLGYCYWAWQMQSWVVIYVSSCAGLFSIGLSAYVVIRLALWRVRVNHMYGC